MKRTTMMLKSGAVVAAVLAGMFWLAGCEEEGTAENSITIDPIGTVTAGGASVAVGGKIEADAVPTVTARITDAGGGTAVGVTVSFTQPTDDKSDLTSDLNMRITATEGACNGTYTLTITATTTTSVTQSISFTVSGGANCALRDTTLSMGAQSATQPSLLDADLMLTYSMVNTPTNVQPSIDVLLFYSTVGTAALRFVSPASAAGVLDDWPAANKKATQFKKVSVNFDALTMQSEIDAAWGTGAGSDRLDIAQGDVIIIQTSENAYKAVRIESISAQSAQAVVSVKGKKN